MNSESNRYVVMTVKIRDQWLLMEKLELKLRIPN